MPDLLSARIRERLGDDASARTAALLAVLDRCEYLRTVSGSRDVTPSIPADVVAREFEQAIARAFNLID